MAFRRRDVTLSVAAAIAAWALSVTWIPSLRLTPYAFALGAFAGSCTLLYFLALATTAVGDLSGQAYPPTASLSFSSGAWESETIGLHDRQSYIRAELGNVESPLDKSLDNLLDLVLRDFVQTWYGRISAGRSFPNEVDRAIRLALDKIAGRLKELDLVQLIVVRLLPIVDGHLDKFVEAEKAVRGRDLGKDAARVSEEVDIAIAAKFDGGKLHAAAGMADSDPGALQKHHLRALVDKILPEVLPDRLTGSSSVLSLIREIVACAVLLPAMQLFTDPDFLNQHIEAYGRAVLQERKTVKKLRAALEGATAAGTQDSLADFPFLSPNDSEKAFEHFIRAIRSCNILQSARRVEGEVSAQIEDEKGQAEQDLTYLRRLEIGKRLLDQRIKQLSDSAARNKETQGLDRNKHTSTSLRDVLYDANGLSYMMEYMDRSDKMAYVQFWIVVDGLRNSSERIIDNTIEEQTTWNEAERQVINKINNNYFWRPELNVPPGAQSAVNDFLAAGDKASLRQYNAARRAVLAVHAQVYYEMENIHFPAFKQTDLFAKTGFPAEAPSTDVESPTEPSFPDDVSKPRRPRAEFRSQTNLAPSSAMKAPDLRRAVASSSDLQRDVRNGEMARNIRRSLDERPAKPASKRPLFDDGDDDGDPLTRSIASLDSDLDSPLELSRAETPPVIQDLRATIDELVDVPDTKSPLFDEQSGQDQDSERGSLDIKRVGLQPERPTLSSLGLLGTPSRRTVFNSDDLFGENEQLWEDEEKHQAGDDERDEDEIRKAAPGDLGLAEVVQSLSIEINKLEAQQTIVKAMLSKAELTNNVAELRILRKSQASLDREIRRKELQRQQYIVQESDNTLFGRASVSIKNIMVGTEPDGHEFALYVVEVTRAGTGDAENDDSSAAVWAVARRYSEFHELHRRLRRQFARVREIEFPRRQMVLALQKEFLKKRRASLERYLRELLKDANICRSLELRAFLSQQTITPQQPSTDTTNVDRKDLVTRIYNSVSDGMEEFLGNVPIIDQLSAAGQNLIAAATTAPLAPVNEAERAMATSIATSPTVATAAEQTTSAEARRELTALETTSAEVATAGPAGRQATTVIAAMASAFLTLFQLRTSTASSWLRGRAVVIVLQQLLGGTVERRTREAVTALAAPAALALQLDRLREAAWPAGGPLAAKTARTQRDRERSRDEAGVVLAAVLMDVAGSVIGRGVAREAGRRVGRMIGNERVLRGLGYRMLDEFVDAVWGVRV